MGLKPLRPLVSRSAPPAVKFQDKVADPFYSSPEWRETRGRILKRDGGQCTAVVNGFRCDRPAIVVDHIKRRRDGGGEGDDNLRSLCRNCDNRMKENWDGRRRGGAVV